MPWRLNSKDIYFLLSKSSCRLNYKDIYFLLSKSSWMKISKILINQKLYNYEKLVIAVHRKTFYRQKLAIHMVVRIGLIRWNSADQATLRYRHSNYVKMLISYELDSVWCNNLIILSVVLKTATSNVRSCFSSSW